MDTLKGKKPLIFIGLIIFVAVAAIGIVIDFLKGAGGVIAIASVGVAFLILAIFLVLETVMRKAAEKKAAEGGEPGEEQRFLRHIEPPIAGMDSLAGSSEGFEFDSDPTFDSLPGEQLPEEDNMPVHRVGFNQRRRGFAEQTIPDEAAQPFSDVTPTPQSMFGPMPAAPFAPVEQETATVDMTEPEEENPFKPVVKLTAPTQPAETAFAQPVAQTADSMVEDAAANPFMRAYAAQQAAQAAAQQPQAVSVAQPVEPVYAPQPTEPAYAQPFTQQPIEQQIPAAQAAPQQTVQQPVEQPSAPQFAPQVVPQAVATPVMPVAEQAAPAQVPVAAPVAAAVAPAAAAVAAAPAQPAVPAGQSLESFYEDMDDEDILYRDCVEVWAADAKPSVLRLMKYIEGIEDKNTQALFGRECEYINAMLDRIYCFTQLEYIDELLELKKYNFAALVKECLKRFSPFFTEKRLGLLWKGLDIDIMTDRRWFVFALTQVVFNSVEFTPEGGKIAISAKRSGDYIDLMVDDSGKGITAEEMPYIFIAGYMGDDSPNEAGRRTGMGLFIARSVINKMGGEVFAESKPGKCTRVTLRMPVIEPSQGSQA